MVNENPKFYIEHFIENSEKVKTETLKKYFYKIDHLSAFFHNLVTCINLKRNDEGTKKLNPYFEQIIEESFLEIAKECENFICLLINGFYDGAIKSLRHVLENFIIHLYFSILERNGNLKKYIVKNAEFYKLIEHLNIDEKEFLRKYEEEKRFSSEDLKKIFKEDSDGFPIYEADSFFCWKQGKQYLESYNFITDKPILKEFPKFKDCLDLIFKQEYFKNNIYLKKEVLELYKQFSKILHNRGTISKYKTISSSLNNHFNKEDVEKGILLYKQIEEIISLFLLFGNFPNFDKNSFTYIPKFKEFKEKLEKNN